MEPWMYSFLRPTPDLLALIPASNLSMAGIQAFPRAEPADGPAAILAIGTANPAHVIDQMAYADYYFRITNAEDKIELKQKFKRICKNKPKNIFSDS